MTYQLQPVHSSTPPFLLKQYNTVCTKCGAVHEGLDNPTRLPNRCPGCKPMNKTNHPLAAAHNAHLRCLYQPITTDWYEWVASPYQVPNTIHPRYAEYRRQTNQQVSFKAWLNYVPPKTPDDYNTDYDLSVSGLSYEQWLNTPPELTRYMKRDWKLSGTQLTFNKWMEQRCKQDNT